MAEGKRGLLPTANKPTSVSKDLVPKRNRDGIDTSSIEVTSGLVDSERPVIISLQYQTSTG